MNAGQMNHRITFQTLPDTPDDYGDTKSNSWADAGTTWAGVVTTGGGEFYAAQKVNTGTEILFTVRYNSVINERMRISYGGKYYEILNINDTDGKNVELKISAKVMP